MFPRCESNTISGYDRSRLVALVQVSRGDIPMQWTSSNLLRYFIFKKLLYNIKSMLPPFPMHEDHRVSWPREASFFAISCFCHISCHFWLQNFPWWKFQFCQKQWIALWHLLWFQRFGWPTVFLANYFHWRVQDRISWPGLLGRGGLRFRFCQKVHFCQKFWLS